MSRVVARAGAIVLIVVCALAAVFSFRLAWADIEFRRGTEESVARAVRILPDSIQYRLFHALQMEYAGSDATTELERAAVSSPMSSAPRLRLGLASEARGDTTNAEKWLLQAAQVDHEFEPRWALANFYFRQNRRDDFWKWMHLALEVSYGDRRPAFDLCWRVGRDAREILERGVPRQRETLVAMLVYVLEKHSEDAGTVATELARFRDPNDVPLLDAACSQLIEADDAQGAVHLWTTAGHSSAGGVSNGDFTSEPTGEGFDWRLDHPPGVARVRLEGRGLRLELSGQQPEDVRLLRQIVLLDPARRYRLEWSARTNGLPEITGLAWTLGQQRFPLIASRNEKGEEKKESVVVAAPKRLTPLELWYQRPTGQVRAEGWVEIREVSLTPLP